MAVLISVFGCSHMKPQKPAEPAALKIWLGGDVNLGDGGKGQLKDIAGMVQGAVGIVNLEGPVMANTATKDKEKDKEKLRLWNSPKALPELHALNVQVAGIANNHARDAGEHAPVRTAELLRSDKIEPAGVFLPPTVFKVGNVSVVVSAYDLTKGVPPKLEQELAAAHKKGEVQIVTFHVSGPASYLPRPELRRAVDLAIKAGADVIAAHGTHAIGPVERRGKTIIAWGLGNVAFACDCTDEKDAILLQLELQPKGPIKADVIPIQAGLDSQPAEPAKDPDGIFTLLESIGSPKLERHGNYASF